MDSKRDLDGEKRLIRNEKARRRRALQYACRYLPIELEKEVFRYMKNPRNGRIDVSMKWQKHPTAKLLWGAPAFDEYMGAFSSPREDYITHLTHKMGRMELYFTADQLIRECREVFTRHMQRTIADKVFKMIFRQDLSDTLALYADRTSTAQWLHVHNSVPWPVATTRYNDLIEWREWLGIDQEKWEKRLPSMQTCLNVHNSQTVPTYDLSGNLGLHL